MLPKVTSPTFEYTLPISKKKIRYRPYTVKEEKMLLIAMQSDSSNEVFNAIKQVISNCVQDKIDVGKLSIFDLEVLIVLLRIVSTSNEHEVIYNDKEDNTDYKFVLDLQGIIDEQCKNVKSPNKNIELNNEIGISMKELTFDAFTQTDLTKLDDSETLYKLLANIIDKVYELNRDKVYVLKDSTDEEITEFIDSFDRKASEKIGNYFEEIPRLKHKIEYENKLGHARSIELEGINDFFI